ncbi:MAG: GGDEF domain-containing protein [Loktanella sp.]|nr:GGDEF domain-containing protein [Loktanella sp.]
MADGLKSELFSIDRFPVSCLATDGARIIRFANARVAAQIEQPLADLLGRSLDVLMTPASRIFCDSFVYPILLEQGYCDEIALNVISGSGRRISVVGNACIHNDDPNLVLWSFMRADKRDQLQAEVLASRNKLQEQARALKTLATRDDLTGLLNRREFKRLFAQLVSYADREAAFVTLLLLDIDRFKEVNDTHGHQAGDDVLRQLGVAFKKMVRTHELAGRYGGEEFIFAIATKDAEEPRPFSYRLHEAAASITGECAPITVSVGLVCSPPGSNRLFQYLFEAADRALYRAKDLGRNRSMIESDGSVMPFD